MAFITRPAPFTIAIEGCYKNTSHVQLRKPKTYKYLLNTEL